MLADWPACSEPSGSRYTLLVLSWYTALLIIVLLPTAAPLQAPDGVAETVGVEVLVAVAVGVRDGVGVALIVPTGVGVRVAVALGVAVRVAVGAIVGVAVGIPPLCTVKL